MTETQPNIAFPDVNLKISVTSWPELPIELQQVCGKHFSPKKKCPNQKEVNSFKFWGLKTIYKQQAMGSTKF